MKDHKDLLEETEMLREFIIFYGEQNDILLEKVAELKSELNRSKH